MPLFQYKALQADGKTAVGELDAGGRQEAFRQMEARGLKPITLAEKAAGKPGKAAKNGAPPAPSTPAVAEASKGISFGSGKKKVTARMLENFTRLLSSLLAAGVPLSRALVILCKEAASPAAAAKWKEVHNAVIDGVSLADAMSRSPDTFPRVYVAMVEAGETGGFLDVVLAQIADFQAREKELRAKVLAALMYPAVLLTLAVGVVIFLMVFFIPRFQTLFEGFDAALPMITQVIVGASHAIRTYGLYLLVAIVAVGWYTRRWFSSESSRRIWENILLRAPVVGPLAAKIAMARFCRMLGTLLGVGVPLMNGLNVARRSLGYQTLIDLVTNATERVKKGESLSASLADCRMIFPGSTLEMISVAQESGRLDQELVRLAAVTETTLDRQLKTAVAMAEPLMLFAIAAVIGVIFIGMVLPIFTIQDYIK